jgi:RNA polymerase sigma-70 factor (ECF subfamily)
VTSPSHANAHEAAEGVARSSYGRLVAFLAARSGDVAGAEDALAEAFARALETWPSHGVPDRPEAWLVTVARRQLIQQARRADVRARAEPTLRVLAAGADRLASGVPFPDDRLKLLFTCAHPAIDSRMHAPLMLQTVLGLDAERIAAAFLVSPSAMGQRLVRVKTKIRDAGIPFAVPRPSELPDRLDAVLEAIYAAYGTGWDDIAGFDPRNRGLTDESVRLAQVVVDLLPDEPEARGLLALMLHCEARRDARRSETGAFVSLAEQDPARWDPALVRDAEEHLSIAAEHGQLGRFQLEASVQSVHALRVVTGSTDWSTIAKLYDGLVTVAPTVGAFVARAAAYLEAVGPAEAVAQLDELPADAVRDYQPFWVVRAEALRREGDPTAEQAYDRAIGLTREPALRDHLRLRASG